jgi:predicted MFS family arabinose efflux permease
LLAAQLGDVGWPVYNIHEISLRQAITPAHLLGRVNAAIHLMFRGVLGLGALAGGALAQAIGVRNTLWIASVGLLLSALWLVFSPIRRVRDLSAVS